MAHTWTSSGITRSFKTGTITASMREDNAQHMEMITLLDNPTNGQAYRDVFEQMLIQENAGGPAATSEFRKTFGLAPLVEIVIPQEIDPNA